MGIGGIVMGILACFVIGILSKSKSHIAWGCFGIVFLVGVLFVAAIIFFGDVSRFSSY
jgi:hypothetical protein